MKGMDALDGSILLDIKPYSVEMDCLPKARIAWQRTWEMKDRDCPSTKGA